MDMNKVWLTGLAVTQPILSKLPNQTPLTVFTLQVNEKYQSRAGHPQIRANLIRIECLGRTATIVAEEVRSGLRYVVDGYVRQDQLAEGEDVRIRAWKVYREDSENSAHHAEGLKQALKILKENRNLEAAKAQLEELLQKK